MNWAGSSLQRLRLVEKVKERLGLRGGQGRRGIFGYSGIWKLGGPLEGVEPCARIGCVLSLPGVFQTGHHMGQSPHWQTAVLPALPCSPCWSRVEMLLGAAWTGQERDGSTCDRPRTALGSLFFHLGPWGSHSGRQAHRHSGWW